MTPTEAHVLIVEDDDDHANLITAKLKSIEVRTTRAATLAEAFAALATDSFALVVLDYWLRNESSVAVLRWIQARDVSPPVIFVTAEDKVSIGVEAMRLGATDYIVKAEGYLEKLTHLVRECLGGRRPTLQRTTPVAPTCLVGTSTKLDHVRKQIERAARSADPVLIIGETGVGKDLVARALHDTSGRSGRFYPVNCPAIPTTLFESELFGTRKGAHTDAIHRDGIVKAADRGTLFLDEIGDLSLETQPKILHLVEHAIYSPVGWAGRITADVRFLAATNRDLQRAISEGRFRADLFYRLEVTTIRVPALRERVEDVPVLTEWFIERYRDPEYPAPKLDRMAVARLMAHPWPGNVRELQNVVKRALQDFYATGVFMVDPVRHDPNDNEGQDDSKISRDHLVQLLAVNEGRLEPVAKELGVTIRTVQRAMTRFGLQRKTFLRRRP